MDPDLERVHPTEGKSIEEPPERLSSGAPEMKELLDKHSQDSTVDKAPGSGQEGPLDFHVSDIYENNGSGANGGDNKLPIQEGKEPYVDLLVDDPIDPEKKYILPLEQSEVKVGASESTMDDLAKKVYGEGLSWDQLKTFAKAVSELNGGLSIPKPEEIVKVPGVNEDGDFVTTVGDEFKTWWDSNSFEAQYANGNSLFQFSDGKQVFKRADGSSTNIDGDNQTTTLPDGTRIDVMAGGRIIHETIPDDNSGQGLRLFMIQAVQNDGSISSRVRGSRPENQFNLIERKNGDLEVTDTKGENPQSFIENDTINGDRQTVLELAKGQISDPLKLAKFKADMIRFENRMAKSGLPYTEINDTYKSLGRLLTDSSDSVLSLDNKSILAQQVISQAAHPVSIDQGQNKTCNVSNSEVRIYARQPSKAADLIADLAQTGKFTGTDGTEVKLASESLIPDSEAKMNPPLDGNRSFATQLFNHTAANLVLNDSGKSYIKTQSSQPDDTGERVVDADGKEIDFNGFSGVEIIKAHEMIAGKSDDIIYIDHKSDNFLKDDNIGKFGNQEEFKNLLIDLKNKGQLPVILKVDTGVEPFANGDQKSGAHVVTVHDIDTDTGLVKVDNQWGSGRDFVNKPIPVEKLFQATSLTQYRNGLIKREFDDNPDKHFDHNYLTALEKIRNQHDLKIDDRDSSSLGSRVIVKADRRWAEEKAEGRFDPYEFRSTRERIDKIYNELPVSERLDVLWSSSGDNHNVYSDKELASMFAALATELKIDPAKLELAIANKESGFEDPTKHMAEALDFMTLEKRQLILDRIKQG